MKFTFAPESRPLDGFTLKRAIYRGGFGEVYYGVSDAGREVALKLLQHNTEVELRGVQQCLNLSHPNLVTIFDVRTDADGDHWIVMEYVSGETLETAIRRHPTGMPVELVRKWLAGIAGGVGFLHDSGLVHRDLKPANIFLDGETVKVGDVGLSKFISPSRQSAHSQSVGTVYYMAPEVAKGRYGKTVDIYALGVILYEMLTGELPFDGESTGEILMKHLMERPDLNKLPPRFRSIIARALEKDPQLRQPSIQILQNEFEAAALGRTSLLPESPAQERSPGVQPVKPGSIRPLPSDWSLRAWIRSSPLLFLALAATSLFLIHKWRHGHGISFMTMLLFAVVIGVIIKKYGRHRLIQKKPSSLPAAISQAESFKPSFTGRMRTICVAGALAPLFVGLLTGVMAWVRPTLFELPESHGMDPGMVGFFSVSMVLAAWGLIVLVPSHRKLRSKKPRRWSAAIAGGIVGVLVWHLSQYLMISLVPSGQFRNAAVFHHLGDHPLMLSTYEPTMIGYTVFFATWFWLRNWSRMISPERPQRFSIGAVMMTVLTAWLSTKIFAFPTEWGLAWGVVLGCCLQLASPWSNSPRPRFIQHN